jgi:ribosomal-protein-alanine N-acetyltransferase
MVLDLSVFPKLHTDHLVLRELQLSDANSLHAIRSDKLVMQHIGRTRSKTVQDSIDLVNRIQEDRSSNNGITWGIAHKDNGALIGTIGFYRLKKEHFRGELGYMLAPEYWGKGLMSEAIQAVVECGFKQLGFHTIEADTDPLNIRSMNVLERNGFKQEGLFRESYYFDGKFFDSAIWCMINPH